MHPAVRVFQEAARRVPAYRTLLQEAGVDPARVGDLEGFHACVPVVTKSQTFGRFRVSDLCLDGELGCPAAITSSSGHGGQLSYGIYAGDAEAAESRMVDEGLDTLFGVRTRPTLLVNCLPMGVRVSTRLCTLAETSVRVDVAASVVAEFARHFRQTILVGDAAVLKRVLELGADRGLRWEQLHTHLVVGGEMLAENARQYLRGLLAGQADCAPWGLIISSMGAAELGLNLLCETPQTILLRQAMHRSRELRETVLGPRATTAPAVFVYDPDRVYLEVLPDGQIVATTLGPGRRLPLIRYATGDYGRWLDIQTAARQCPEAAAALAGVQGLPVLLVSGRGESVSVAGVPVTPEEVKEGLYADPSLARQTTANFRLTSSPERALVRLQLAPGVEPSAALEAAFGREIGRWVPAPVSVRVEAYHSFGDGMTLDYERKFAYLVGQAGR